jgi:hypothetical protein
MTNDGDANDYLRTLNKQMKPLASELHNLLLNLGCISYVKTIYIGYAIDGVMVAALYGHIDHVEIALALPEDSEEDLLVDASHLTWRTLPVAAIVQTKQEISQFSRLASTAVERVRTSSHSVNRDNDFFVRSKRERRGL